MYSKLGIVSAITQIEHKNERLLTLCSNKALRDKAESIDDSIEDTLLDMANYCIMTYMELINSNNKKGDNKDECN